MKYTLSIEASSFSELYNLILSEAESMKAQHGTISFAEEQLAEATEEQPAVLVPIDTEEEPTPEPAPKKVAKKAKKPAAKAKTNGAVSPTQEELVPIMQAYAAKHGATKVREALMALGAAKLSDLDETGRGALAAQLTG